MAHIHQLLPNKIKIITRTERYKYDAIFAALAKCGGQFSVNRAYDGRVLAVSGNV